MRSGPHSQHRPWHCVKVKSGGKKFYFSPTQYTISAATAGSRRAPSTIFHPAALLPAK